MAKLQYKSMDEINSSPAALLDFAQNLKTTYEAGSTNMGFPSFLSAEVTVGGKPFSMARQMMDLCGREFDIDLQDLKRGQIKDPVEKEAMEAGVRQLKSANAILLKLEKTWDISDHMADPSLGVEMKNAQKVDPTSGLAGRMTGLLKPAEHTVRAGLHP